MRVIPYQLVEVLIHPKSSGATERLVDRVRGKGLPAVQYARDRRSRQRCRQDMHVVSRYGKTPQYVALAVEMMQRIGHDALGFGPAQGTGAMARVQPILYAVMEQTVPLMLQRKRQFAKWFVPMSTGPSITICNELIEHFLGQAVGQPPCEEVELSILIPVRQVATRLRDLTVVLKEGVVENVLDGVHDLAQPQSCHTEWHRLEAGVPVRSSTYARP